MKLQLLFVTLLYASTPVFAQDNTKYITLQQEKIPLRLSNIHITSILDTRPDTSQIGTIHTGLTGKRSITLKLNPNLPASFHQFIKTNYIQDTSTTPIEIRIARLQTTHSRTGLKSRAEISYGVVFFTNGEKITDYNGDGYSEGPGDPTKPIEELIRENLKSSLAKFDTWWARNKSQFLASGGAPMSVTVQATIVNTVDDSDMIAYNYNRPLKLTDFSGPVDDLSKAAAVSHSGIQLYSTSQMQDGHIKVKVYITPYFNKSKSWCRKHSRNAKTLAHEQRHFDITAMKACELLKTVQQYTFTSNFVKELELLHKKNEKEWDLLQNQYDDETKHGQAAGAQQKWDKLVQEELAKGSCFK